LVNELLNRGLNTGAIFEADADPARLRKIYELQHSDPAEAFAQFLGQAECGSVWSMIQVGHAYATGEGLSIDRAQAKKWFLAACANGSDFGLLWASNLAFKRGDSDRAKSLLKEGIARGIPRAKLDLAG
jgi:TPR repeat protein